MKSMSRGRLVIALAVAALAFVTAPGVAQAAPAGSPGRAGSAHDALVAQLRERPGRVVGHRVYYPDGTVFVAVARGVESLGQCDSGQFCIWQSSGFSGSFSFKQGQDVTRQINVTVGSFWNNRAKGARLYNNGSTGSTCYGPGASAASVAASYSQADKVYLSDTTGC